MVKNYKTLRSVIGSLCMLLAAPVFSQTQAQTKACPPIAQAPTTEQVKEQASKAQDRGFLWQISKDGRSSYLYGTMHIGKLQWAFPGPEMVAALKQSEVIALELDISDPQIIEQFKTPALEGLPKPSLSKAVQARIDKQFDATCLPKEVGAEMASSHPILQMSTLTLLDTRWIGLDAGYASELTLIGIARQTGKRTLSLETPAEQLKALIGKDEKAASDTVSDMLSGLEDGSARTQVQQLAEVWAASDWKKLQSYEQWCDCIKTDNDRDMLKRLNDDRNPVLADRIAALHAKGDVAFAAVGALHMTGPAGLPALLKKQGFELKQLVPKTP
jgi:uncharacterized protein